MGSEPTSSSRPWWKLHIVTVVIALVIVLAAVARNLDGGVMPAQEIMSTDGPKLTYGWPMVFAVRTWDYTRPLMGEGRLLILHGGTVNGVPVTTTEMRYGLLFVNLLITIVILLGTTSVIERLLRRSANPLQFSLRGLFAFVAFFATMVSLFRGTSFWNEVYNLSGVILMFSMGLTWLALFNCIDGMRDKVVRPDE